MKLIKNSIAVFLLILLGLQTNYLMVYFVLFELNKDAIITELCEKSRPGCNACCYLDKKMNEEGDRAKADPVSKNVTRDNIKISEYIVSKILLDKDSGTNFLTYRSLNTDFYSPGYPGTIDHPPRV